MSSNQFLQSQMAPKKVLAALPKPALNSSRTRVSFEETVIQTGCTQCLPSLSHFPQLGFIPLLCVISSNITLISLRSTTSSFTKIAIWLSANCLWQESVKVSETGLKDPRAYRDFEGKDTGFHYVCVALRYLCQIRSPDKQ